MKQETFGALWLYAAEIQNGMLLEEAEKLTKKAYLQRKKELKQQGIKFYTSSFGRQLRQYWGFGNPCGLTCTSRAINII